MKNSSEKSNISNKTWVLVVDDEKDLCTLISMSLTRIGILSDTASSIQEAKVCLTQKSYHLCLTDMRLPDGEGIALVKHIHEHYPNMPVAVITAHANMNNAIVALKAGAFDYLAKPIPRQQLYDLVKSALSMLSLPQQSHSALSADQTSPQAIDSLIGENPKILALKKMLVKLGRTNAPVFIFGESGSGKELVARAVHQLSGRAKHPFVAVNCGAIPESLTESEFFGYRKGSFTGATTDRDGLFQAAHGGSLFLDEIADLPLSMQIKLLRAIQEKQIRRVGDTKEIAVDVRIISATHHDVKDCVQQGTFRQDLYYRLNVLDIYIPPLRERVEDIPHIAKSFLKRLAPSSTLSSKTCEKLMAYTYPGNVRELENILERAVALANSNEILPEDIGLFSNDSEITTTFDKDKTADESVTPDQGFGSHEETHQALDLSEMAKIIYEKVEATKHTNTFVAHTSLNGFLETAESWIIDYAMQQCEYDQVRAAAYLGLTPTTLAKKWKSYQKKARLEK